MENKLSREDTLTRLALCAAAAAGAVWLCETLLPEAHLPLWEKYGPWVRENKIQAIALAAGVIYVLSLALWPEGEGQEEGFTPV